MHMMASRMVECLPHALIAWPMRASTERLKASRSYLRVSANGVRHPATLAILILALLNPVTAFNPSHLETHSSEVHPNIFKSPPVFVHGRSPFSRRVPRIRAALKSKAEANKKKGLHAAGLSLPELGKNMCNSTTEPFKINMYALREDELTALLVSWGQPKFRAKQVKGFLYDRPVTDVEQMHNLPKALRALLREQTSFGSMSVAHEAVSSDGTRKRLWKCYDSSLIESVLMPYNDNRRTACISSQVGCAMGCTFCATGQMGFKRDLSEAEIFEQAARFSAELKAKDERLSNIVFMGMGEPFMNYDAVLGAARRIMSELGIGARHLTISTSGLVPEIRRFADECAETGLEVKLAISLHESDDATRSTIMPVNRKYDLNQLLDACHYYVKKTGRRISFEWALIAGRNDDAESARRLANLLRGIKCHVNLIPLNPTTGFEGQPTSLPNADKFVHVLEKRGIPATVRVRRGIDIDAGCGQLADAVSKEKAAKRRADKKAEPERKLVDEAKVERPRKMSLRVKRAQSLRTAVRIESEVS